MLGKRDELYFCNYCLRNIRIKTDGLTNAHSQGKLFPKAEGVRSKMAGLC